MISLTTSIALATTPVSIFININKAQLNTSSPSSETLFSECSNGTDATFNASDIPTYYDFITKSVTKTTVNDSSVGNFHQNPEYSSFDDIKPTDYAKSDSLLIPSMITVDASIQVSIVDPHIESKVINTYEDDSSIFDRVTSQFIKDYNLFKARVSSTVDKFNKFVTRAKFAVEQVTYLSVHPYQLDHV